MASFLDADGEPVGHDGLSTPKARDLVQLLVRGHPYARLVECRVVDAEDVVVVDLDVEVPQAPAHDIRSVERASIGFDREDRRTPEVLALRADFPVVPHQNLRPRERPRSLCLFEEHYVDLKRRWTAAMLVERLREWLRLTARGELHGDDQPLEVLLLTTAGTIIVPHDLFGTHTSESVQPVSLEAWQDDRGRWMVVAQKVASTGSSSSRKDGPQLVAATFSGVARQHGAIRRTPATLAELHDLLAEGGDDLLGHIRNGISSWKEAPTALESRLLLLVSVPKTRTAGSEVEVTDLWAFLTSRTIRQIGEAVGKWEVKGGHIGALLPIDTSKRGEAVSIELLNVVRTLPRAGAAWLSGRSAPTGARLTAIGAGALGSQVLMNAARSAFGRWTVIDDDFLLPHNLVRHASDRRFVGGSKSLVVSLVANDIVDEAPAFTPIVADVLSPGDQQSAVETNLREADAIVDMSASLSVSRFLARDAPGSGRRIAAFLNPAGTDVVLLAEDRARAISLDIVEMQYYRVVLHDPALAGHLQAPPGRVRYGRSCRDVSARLSQELVSLHAALITRALREALDSDNATCRVWQAGDGEAGVRAFRFNLAPAREYRCGEWTICTDAMLLNRLAQLRDERLPRETGGVLLGTFDLGRRIVYIADTIPSPPDSSEWPTAYIRGCEGLEGEVRQAEERTGQQLQYVGEWHAHPSGHECQPSKDDLTLLAWLTHQMGSDGLPGIVLIVGDGAALGTYMGIPSADDTVTVTAGVP
jgi:hypothetical protein